MPLNRQIKISFPKVTPPGCRKGPIVGFNPSNNGGEKMTQDEKWVKHTRKVMNQGRMKQERVDFFNELLINDF